LVAVDYLGNYMPVTGGTFTGDVTFGGGGGDIAGLGTASFVVGTAAGSGATAVCANYSNCDSFSGTITLTTGAGGLAVGTVLTISIPGSRSSNPNCPWGFGSTTDTTFRAPYSYTGNPSGSFIYLSVGVALQASTPYTFSYVCGGL
jgi:hypothetical protein